MEDLEIDEVCRICLTKQEDMQLAGEVGVIDRLLDCASVELPSDSLICEFCNNEVNKWYSFKQQVLKSLEVAEYLEKHSKKKSVLEDNYVVIEECFIKTEIEEEIDIKPDIAEIDALINQDESETANSEETHSVVTENTFECGICDRTFYSRSGFSTHNTRLHGKKGKSRTSPPKIKEESDPSSSTQQDNKYQCDLCHKSFNSKMGMVWHKKLHSALKLDSTKGALLFSCPHCPMAYEKKQSLIDHMKWKHNRLMKRNSQLYICDFCGKYCKSKSEYRVHTRLHKGEKQYKCTMCSRSFVTVHSLVLHRSVHTDTESPFACTQCGRRFRKESYLATHQATHIRPFKCQKCNKTFGKKHMLKRHLENNH